MAEFRCENCGSYKVISQIDPATEKLTGVRIYKCMDCGHVFNVDIKSVEALKRIEGQEELRQQRKEQQERKEKEEAIKKRTEEYLKASKKEQEKILPKYKETGLDKYLGEKIPSIGEERFGVGRTIYGNYVTKVVPTLGSIIVGIVVFSIIGSFWFFAGFLALGFYFILPEPQDTYSVKKKIRDVKRYWDNEIRRARTEKELEERLSNAEKALRIEKIVADVASEDTPFNSLLLGKNIAKALAFLLFVIAFALSSLPLAGFISIIAAFILYFSIGGYHKPEEEEK